MVTQIDIAILTAYSFVPAGPATLQLVLKSCGSDERYVMVGGAAWWVDGWVAGCVVGW